MDRNKAIDKIKKCLALGKSANANEAATALRQAQKLMQEHQLSEDDLEGFEYGCAAVECPIQAGKTVPVHLQEFVRIINTAFQVKLLSNRICEYPILVIVFGTSDQRTGC